MFLIVVKIMETEEDEFKVTYANRSTYIPIPLHKKYSPIPLKIQIPPTCPGVYTTEHIFVPEHWDQSKRIRFIGYVYKTYKPNYRSHL